MHLSSVVSYRRKFRIIHDSAKIGIAVINYHIYTINQCNIYIFNYVTQQRLYLIFI